jgi:hypothetical protein
MFTPKKREDPAATAKMRLPTESAIPTVKMLQAQFAEASNKAKRGLIVELPWTTDVASQQFVLMVQWKKGAEFPVWTLYEENGTESTMHWSQIFQPSDIQMVYDVTAMTCLAPASAKAKIPDSLKPVPEAAKPASGSAPTAPQTANFVHPSQQQSAQPQAPVPPPAPQAGYPQPMPAQPGYGQPNMGYPPPPPQGYGQPLPSPQSYPPPGQPNMGYPPPGYAPMPNQAPYPTPDWAYPQPYAQGVPAAPVAPTTAPSPQPAQQNSSANTNIASTMPFDFGLTQKRPNILLGTLLVEAGLITEPSLEAALKLQEMVREEKMAPDRAGEALKHLHALGSSIDQYLSPMEFDKTKSSQTAANVQAELQQGASNSPDPKKDMNAAFDLLIKAGILKEDDIKTAFAVRSKHGGDVIQILESAGKTPKATFEAALICQAMIRKGFLKIEQCIIALNYCFRSRIGFDEAFEELGWSNPRK